METLTASEKWILLVPTLMVLVGLGYVIWEFRFRKHKKIVFDEKKHIPLVRTSKHHLRDHEPARN